MWHLVSGVLVASLLSCYPAAAPVLIKSLPGINSAVAINIIFLCISKKLSEMPLKVLTMEAVCFISIRVKCMDFK